MATIYLGGIDVFHNEGYNYISTNEIKTKLKSMKCTVIIPLQIPSPRMNWSANLNNRLELLKNSQAIYVLPNWKDSIMARIELTVAMDMKLHTLFHPISNEEIKQFLTTLDN